MHAASACVRVHAVCLFHILQKTPALYAYMVQAVPAEQELADLCPLACSLVLSRHQRACSTPANGRYKIMGKHIVRACTLGLFRWSRPAHVQHPRRAAQLQPTSPLPQGVLTVYWCKAGPGAHHKEQRKGLAEPGHRALQEGPQLGKPHIAGPHKPARVWSAESVSVYSGTQSKQHITVLVCMCACSACLKLQHRHWAHLMCRLLTWTVLPNLFVKVMLLSGSRSCSACKAQWASVLDQA